MDPKDRQNSPNYLDYVPTQAVEHERRKDGRIVLLRPRYVKGLLAKFFQPRIKDKYYRVRLDPIGSETWTSIDGQRTVGKIADLLFEKFGDAIEPRYERCAEFIHSLHHGAMITLAEDLRAEE